MRWATTISMAAGLALALACGTAAAQPSDPSTPSTPSTRDRIVAAGRAELASAPIVPRQGLLYGLHAGYHGDVAGMLELRVGWGTGKTKESLYLPVTKLWRISAAARGAYGREDTVALSLLGGLSRVAIIGYSLEAGLDARVIGDGDAAFGPIASLGIRSGKAGLHVNVWTHFAAGETDWGFSLALGFNLRDSVGAGDVVRKRARQRVQSNVSSIGGP